MGKNLSMVMMAIDDDRLQTMRQRADVEEGMKRIRFLPAESGDEHGPALARPLNSARASGDIAVPTRNGLLLFNIGPDSGVLAAEDVRRGEDEG
jgi:hypothetical protein